MKALRHSSTWLVGAVLALALSTAPEARAEYPDGFYISLGLGYAHVLGERAIEYEVPSRCSAFADTQLGAYLWLEDTYECWTVGGFIGSFNEDTINEAHAEMARTDFGSGMGIQITLGYNILGYVSPEISIFGHGGASLDDGAVHVGMNVRYHFIQHIIENTERDWDVNVFFGAGYSIGGYHPDEDLQTTDDGKGWEGYNFTFGAGFDYAVLDFLSVGLDMHFVMPRWQSWIVNFDNGVRSTPIETPMTLVIAPLVHAKFHP